MLNNSILECFMYSKIDFGKRLAIAREAKGLTQTQLGERVERSKGAISQWENGTGEPDLQTLFQVCDILGITVEFLAKGSDDVDFSEPVKAFATHLEAMSEEKRRSFFSLFGPPATDETVSRTISAAPVLSPHKREPQRPGRKTKNA